MGLRLPLRSKECAQQFKVIGERTAVDVGLGDRGVGSPPEVQVIDPVHDAFRAVK